VIDGEALSIEQVNANLEAIGVASYAAMDHALIEQERAQNLVEALEAMAASMSSQNAHPSTIEGVAAMIELAMRVKDTAEALAQATEALHAASEAVADTVQATDGTVREAVIANGGHVATEGYYTG
jgi:hypothetical protein